jgi:hypothetical protein
MKDISGLTLSNPTMSFYSSLSLPWMPLHKGWSGRTQSTWQLEQSSCLTIWLGQKEVILTKGELIERMKGLPDDTEIVWEDSSDGAHWTFLDMDVEVELLVRVEVAERHADAGFQFWERRSALAKYERPQRVRVVCMKPVVVLG